MESKCRSVWVYAVPPFAVGLMKNQALPLLSGLGGAGCATIFGNNPIVVNISISLSG
ncbi:hypothetical protein ACFE6N_21770 [Pedobacter sp. BG31]